MGIEGQGKFCRPKDHLNERRTNQDTVQRALNTSLPCELCSFPLYSKSSSMCPSLWFVATCFILHNTQRGKKSTILLTPVHKFLKTKRLSDNFSLLLSLSLSLCVLLSLSQYVVKPTAEHRSCCALVIWCSYFSWTELENFLWYNWMENAGWQNEMVQTGAWLESGFGIFLFLRKSIVETVSS